VTAGEIVVDARETNERERRIRARNRALLAVLLGLVALVYVMAIVRMSGG
jgi:hypothetical protein